jgi:hypothetical protein
MDLQASTTGCGLYQSLSPTGNLESINGNLQAAQAAFIRGRKVSGPDIDLYCREQQRRNSKASIAGGAHLHK